MINIKSVIYTIALWLCLLASAVTVFYAGAGVAMVFGLLRGSPWTQFFLIRLGFWGLVFVASKLVMRVII